MKKLLSLLGAVVLTASSSSFVVSYSYAPNPEKAVNRETDFYSRVSAEALKAGVLADQNLNINGISDAGVDTDFTTDYLSSKSILSTFGDMYSKNQGAKPDPTAQVSSLFGITFGKTSTDPNGYDYNIKDSYGSLSDNNGVKENTPLYSLVHGGEAAKKRLSQLQKPSSSVASALNLVSGLANIVFKNDFDPSMGETLISLLTSSTVKNAVKDKGDLFNTIDSAITENGEAASKLLASLTQSKLAANSLNNGSTYSSVLSDSTKDLFGSLIYFVSGKKYMYKTDGTAKDDGLTAFIKLVTKDKSLSDDVKPCSGPKDNYDYSEMIESLSGIVSFGITLVHYFRQFDSMFAKIPSPLDGNHLFSDDLTNGQAIAKVLNQKYAEKIESDPNNKNSKYGQDDFWYTDQTDGTYYTKLNLQNLISDLQYYLSPADATGHQPLRLFAELLGGPTNGLNPILQTVVSAISPMGKTELSSLIQSIPVVGSLIGASRADLIADAVIKAGKTAVIDFINWFTSDGDDPKAGSVRTMIKTITDILGNIKLSSFANDSDRKVLAIVDGVIGYLNSSDGDSFYNHPWSTIYGGGILNSIGSIMRDVASTETNPDQEDTDSRIGYALQRLGDLRTILVMNFKDLFKNIGILVNKPNMVVPDWLYLGNKMSIASLIDYLANKAFVYIQDGGTDQQKSHTSNEYNPLSENKYFSFNSNSFVNLIDSLIPLKDTPENSGKTKVQLIKDGKTEPVSPILPIYYAIMNYGGNDAGNIKGTYQVKLSGDKQDWQTIISDKAFPDPAPHDASETPANVYVSTQAFEYLLGVDDTSSDTQTLFRQGSLLMGVSNIYGHWYATDGTKQTVINDGVPINPNDLNSEDINANANAAESLFSVFSDFATFASNSIAQLTNDVYGKYFDPKHWKIVNEKQAGLDVEAADSSQLQQIDYDLKFYNSDSQQWVTYHVMMQRQAVNMGSIDTANNQGWVVMQLMRQN